MENQEDQSVSNVSLTEEEKARINDHDSTVTTIDLDRIPETKRAALLLWFYSSKFIFILIFVTYAFILIISGRIDQYVYAGIASTALVAYLTGKIEKNYFKK